MAKPSRPRMKRPAPVSELLSTLFAGTPAESRLKEGAIWEVWDRTVGSQIASRAKPAAIRNGVLTVVVSSAPWLQQLSFLKDQIREKLNTALGEEMVKDIFLRAGSVQKEPAEASSRPILKKKPRPLTPEELEAIASATEELADPELRGALSALFSRHLADCPDQESPSTPSASAP